MISSKKKLCLTVAFLAAFVSFVANAQQSNPSSNPDPNTPTNRPPHPIITQPGLSFQVVTRYSSTVVLVECPPSSDVNPGVIPDVIMAQLQLINGMLHFDFNQSISVYSVILRHNGRQYGYYFNWTTTSLDVPFPGDEGLWDICVQMTDGRMYCMEGLVSSDDVRSDAACDFIP